MAEDFGRPRPGEIEGLLFFLILCLLIPYHAFFLSFFRETTVDVGDSLLNVYLLEHGFRWMTFQPLHGSLWSPPIFYPHPHVAGYTDLLVGFLPPYAIWRFLGIGSQTAFQLWVLTVTALNYLSCYLFLRVLTARSVPASIAGSILFAIGAPRMVMNANPQLIPAFYIVACLAGLFLLFNKPAISLSAKRVNIALFLFTGGTLGQLYGAFYFGWFLAFSLAIAAIYAMLHTRPRKALIDVTSRWWIPIAGYGIGGVLLLTPLVYGYSMSLRDLGARDYGYVSAFLPNLQAWLYEGGGSWIYGWMSQVTGIEGHLGAESKRDGIGLLTTALVLWGFLRFRKMSAIALLGAVSAAIVVLSLAWPGGFSLWQIVFRVIPGASAIRAVGRVGIFLLLPEAVALSMAVDWLGKSRYPALAIAAIFCVLMEQAVSVTMSPKSIGLEAAMRNSAKLGPECKSFLYSGGRLEAAAPAAHTQTIGMWTELVSGRPSLNGYSGGIPPRWPFSNPSAANRGERVRLIYELRKWMASENAPVDHVCWINLDAQKAALIPDDTPWPVLRIEIEMTGRPLTQAPIAANPAEVVRSLMETGEFQRREWFVVAGYRAALGKDVDYATWSAAVEDLASGQATQRTLIESWLAPSGRSGEAGDVEKRIEGQEMRKWKDRFEVLVTHFCLLQRDPRLWVDDFAADPIERILASSEYRQRFP